ncbi:GNAT family N-acetyltransferase [Vagococcus elongatus]|uniref:N-acetyltransferase domain-containing protein n=1 Tax=Vagococcus elongatus TaxID=180344 RepID=A0A430AY95_9ENTE|nr:GNAT family N-acetyltransferase [Vagococcus elongatus]RSU13019.1 hypothetical protein CBF29_04945 [Vagococcus elongatus]
MVLRTISSKDNQAVERLVKSSLKEVGLAMKGTAYMDPQLSQLSQFYLDTPKSRFWVIEDEDEVVACGGYGPIEGVSDMGELQKLYVRKDKRGQGLSKQLMDHILSHASQDYDYLYIETHHILKEANSLYQQYDFNQISRPLGHPEHSAMDCWYIKKLK